MTYTVEELENRFKSLPIDIQKAMTALETADAIGEIQTKYKLHIDQSGDLAEEVGLVMLGITRPFDFVTRIATKLRVTQMVASQITKDINETIFNPIKESLKKVHSLDREETSKTGPSDIPTEPTSVTAPQEQVSTSNAAVDQLFDQKLKGLFTSSSSTPPSSNDPYREPLE